jgi:protein phosphatase 4 regulatory subunit 3
MTTEMEETDQTTINRVRVYELDDESQWEEKGTGHVSCQYVEV